MAHGDEDLLWEKPALESRLWEKGSRGFTLPTLGRERRRWVKHGLKVRDPG